MISVGLACDTSHGNLHSSFFRYPRRPLAAYAYATLGLLTVALLLPESLAPDRRRRDSLREVLGVYGTLLRDRAYMAYILSGGLIIAGMFAYIAASPFVFIELFHVRPERYGLFFGTIALGLITASQVNGRLARSVNPRTIIRIVFPTTAVAGVVLLLSAAALAGALGSGTGGTARVGPAGIPPAPGARFLGFYFSAIATAATWRSHSSRSSAFPPPLSARMYFSCSTSTGGLLIVIRTRPTSWDAL